MMTKKLSASNALPDDGPKAIANIGSIIVNDMDTHTAPSVTIAAVQLFGVRRTSVLWNIIRYLIIERTTTTMSADSIRTQFEKSPPISLIIFFWAMATPRGARRAKLVNARTMKSTGNQLLI